MLLAALLFIFQAATSRAVDFQSVVVKPGDTLWSISAQYLKDPTKWGEIVKHNPSISTDPTIALPGMTLRIPSQLIKDELRAARLVSRINKVLFRRSATATWNPGFDNMDLYRNDWIRTMSDSAANVRFIDDDVLRLGSNSMAVIKPINKDYAVELKQGGTFFGRSKIVTAGAVVTPQTRDTRYVAAVREDMSTKIEVLTGEAVVAAAGKSVSVKMGMTSEVPLGQAPSVPVAIADMPAFEARAAELKSGMLNGLRPVKTPSAPAQAAPAASVPDANDPRTQLGELKLGSMVSGYRIQCSEVQDLSDLLVSKNIDWGQGVTADLLGIAPGQYWCRVAPLDLLGVAGKFANPRRYTLR